MKHIVSMTVAVLAYAAIAGPAEAAPKYGCFKVTAETLNIRASAFSTGAVIGTAPKGAILVKRKRFCTLRGFWCAVSYKGIAGWADKSFFTKSECPANLSLLTKQ